MKMQTHTLKRTYTALLCAGGLKESLSLTLLPVIFKNPFVFEDFV